MQCKHKIIIKYCYIQKLNSQLCEECTKEKLKYAILTKKNTEIGQVKYECSAYI